MCGLYSIRKSPEEVKAAFDYVEEPQFPPREHVAPGQPVAIVRGEKHDRHFTLVRWGFVPSWSKEMKPGKPLANARVETVFEKPSFRHAIRCRRCLIPADGFYEWRREVSGSKQPFYISRSDNRLFAMAGIWEYWLSPDGSELESMAVLTTDANDMMSGIHHRMPVIIRPGDFDEWLDHTRSDGKSVTHLMKPVENDFLQATATEMARPQRKAAQPAKPVQNDTEDQLSLL